MYSIRIHFAAIDNLKNQPYLEIKKPLNTRTAVGKKEFFLDRNILIVLIWTMVTDIGMSKCNQQVHVKV